jgi:hypothetical protein
MTALVAAARENGWPLHAGVCAAAEAPGVSALMAACTHVVVTSLREGFGLVYFEAALAGRPLAARLIPGTREMLAEAGVPYSHGWTHLAVPPESYDGAAEAARRGAQLTPLQRLLPAELHGALHAAPRLANDFGKLSLAAQLEVLAQPTATLRAAAFPFPAQSFSPRRSRLSVLTPQAWAARLLESARGPAPAPAAGWADRTAEAILPRVASWLETPLLWPLNAR